MAEFQLRDPNTNEPIKVPPAGKLGYEGEEEHLRSIRQHAISSGVYSLTPEERGATVWGTNNSLGVVNGNFATSSFSSISKEVSPNLYLGGGISTYAEWQSGGSSQIGGQTSAAVGGDTGLYLGGLVGAQRDLNRHNIQGVAGIQSGYVFNKNLGAYVRADFAESTFAKQDRYEGGIEWKPTEPSVIRTAVFTEETRYKGGPSDRDSGVIGSYEYRFGKLSDGTPVGLYAEGRVSPEDNGVFFGLKTGGNLGEVITARNFAHRKSPFLDQPIPGQRLSIHNPKPPVNPEDPETPKGEITLKDPNLNIDYYDLPEGFTAYRDREKERIGVEFDLNKIFNFPNGEKPEGFEMNLVSETYGNFGAEVIGNIGRVFTIGASFSERTMRTRLTFSANGYDEYSQVINLSRFSGINSWLSI